MTRTLIGAAALALGAAGGCARYTHPGLSVAEVTMREESGTGYVLDFALDARNDNAEPLPLREVRYALTLDGREVFRGVRSAQATVRRFGTQRIHLPASVPLGPGESPPRGVVPYTLSGELSYITPGQIARVLFDARVRRPRVPFREDGRLDLAPSTGGAGGAGASGAN